MTEALTRLPEVLWDSAQREADLLARNLETRAIQNASARLRRRSGNLLDSIAGRTFATGGLIEVTLRAGNGPEDEYVRAQEEGATIVPVNAEFLEIPVGDARTPAGVKRYANSGSDPETVVRIVNRQRTAGVVLGRDRRVRWVLTKGPITIPATHFASDAWDAFLNDFPLYLEQQLAETARVVLRG